MREIFRFLIEQSYANEMNWTNLVYFGCFSAAAAPDQEKEDGPLFKFWEVINDFGSEYVNRMRNLNDLTIFAPSNEAWMEANLNNIIRDRQRMAEILNLHIVRDRLNTDKIKHNNLNQVRVIEQVQFFPIENLLNKFISIYLTRWHNSSKNL